MGSRGSSLQEARRISLTLPTNSLTHFTGLWICTPTGVLRTGKASIEHVLAIAETVSVLNVEDAEASQQADKDMIDAAVLQNGGFDVVNAFIRRNVRNNLGLMRTSFEN